MYAEILLNHAYSRKQESFTYEIPPEMDIQKGSGVVVPFIKGEKAGLVLSVKKERPEFDTKKIKNLLEPSILLQDWQMQLANWISEYYFCSRFDVYKTLIPKNIWRLPKRAMSKTIKEKKWEEKADHELSKEQSEIVNSILEDKIPISLIHGITGAGKTEIYKHVIKDHIKSGKQALLLVPEISLTPQLVKYFQGSFKEIAVIHSRISEGKRAEQWKKIVSGEIKLIIGSRSAIFSPFKSLGVIIMDEEHEWTYKQDQSPRYHARDIALKINELTGAQVIFGSATPSIETMWNAKEGHYKLFSINKRISGTALPKVEIVDMREELRAQNFTMFSSILEQKISAKLDKNEQIILFLNRRGSASATVCRDCGHAIQCKNCDTKLTYHASKFQHKTLICHHCGIITKLPDLCNNCNSTRIRHFGIGTEKVEFELQKLFPMARIFRADRDTMTKKESFKELHKKLIDHEIDILIGTQMIGKGLDIPKVSLVGIILADMGIHIPDFRSGERSFQLLTQVAGRAGRRKEQGEVIIQTYNPDHPSISHSKEHDYNRFYEQEISARKAEGYPPFKKIIKLIFVDKDKDICKKQASKVYEMIKDSLDHEIYLAPALIPKINNKYHWHILIQGPNPRQILNDLSASDLETCRIDVDPIHTV